MTRTINYVIRIFDVGVIYYLIALILAGVLWVKLRNKKITQRLALSVLIPYLFLVVIATVVSRQALADSHFIITPFWTIKSILSGGRKKAWLVKEVVLNILMLMPVGLLTPVLFEKRKLVKTLLGGSGMSVMIELLQLITHRGYAEVDDIIYNMLGVLVGLGIYSVVKKIIIVVNRRRNSARQ